MSWFPDLEGEIGQFKATPEERVALMILADRLEVAAGKVQLSQPQLTRWFTMPAIVFRKDPSVLVFCIEDPETYTLTCAFVHGNDWFIFRNPNLRERLRCFAEYVTP